MAVQPAQPGRSSVLRIAGDVGPDHPGGLAQITGVPERMDPRWGLPGLLSLFGGLRHSGGLEEQAEYPGDHGNQKDAEPDEGENRFPGVGKQVGERGETACQQEDPNQAPATYPPPVTVVFGDVVEFVVERQFPEVAVVTASAVSDRLDREQDKDRCEEYPYQEHARNLLATEVPVLG